MTYNKPHIKNLDDLLRALQSIETNEQKRALVESIKQIRTDEQSLMGAILFLKDHDWDLDHLKNALDKTNLKLDAVNKKVSKTKWVKSRLKYAAMLILPLGLWSAYYLTSYPNRSIDQLYVEEPGLPNFMNDIKPDKWNGPMTYFKDGDFRSTLELLNNSNVEKNNDTLLYFKAVSNYKLGHYQKSLSFFKEHLNHPYSSFHADTEFRIGFAWYKLGDTKRARQQFMNIANSKDHPYNKEAKRILSEIF